MAKELPTAPNLEHFKKQAKQILSGHRNRDPQTLGLIKSCHPEFATFSLEEIANRAFALADAQLVLARDYAFPSWPKLKKWVEDSGDALRPAWVDAIKREDIVAVSQLIALQPDLAASSHIEFDDPWRKKKFPTQTLDFVAAGPWPQTPECRAWNKSRQANLALVRLLLDHGAQADGDTHHGPCLCWIRDPEVAALLVQRGGQINRWYFNGGSPLNFACWSDDPERIPMLLRLGADPNGADPVSGESCLHEAAGRGATECVRLLLEAGADPNARCIENENMENFLVLRLLPGKHFAAETPLHRAALWGDAACIRQLLEHGANPSARTTGGETPRDWALLANRLAPIPDLLLEE